MRSRGKGLGRPSSGYSYYAKVVAPQRVGPQGTPKSLWPGKGRSRTLIIVASLCVMLPTLFAASAFVFTSGGRSGAATTSYNFFGTTVPATIDKDPGAVELGIRFTTDVDGWVTGVRYYKSAANGGTHTGSLWSSSGTRLATATFAGETSTGWQSVSFASPVAVTAGTTYVASYHTSVGRYAVQENFFTSPLDRSPLHAPASTSAGGNDVYKYGSGGFPNQTYKASNYFVDVSFQTSAPGSDGSQADASQVTVAPATAAPTTVAPAPTTTAAPATTVPRTTTTVAPAPPTTAAPTPTTAPPATPTTAAPTPTTAPPAGGSGTPTTYPAPGTVGASGTLTDVYPPGGVLSIHSPTTLSNVHIHGGLDIYADTQLHNVYVEQNGAWWGNIVVRNGASLVATDCTVKPDAITPNDARKQDGVLDVDASSITIQRCDISIAGKGGLIGDNTLIEDSWFHDFTPYLDPSTGAWTHKDAVMTMGGNNIVIRRDNFVTNNPDPYNATTNPYGFDSSTQTGAILLQPWSPITNVTIDHSFLQGGYFALRMQATSPDGSTPTGLSGLVVTNNVFGPLPKGGGYYTYDAAAQIQTWSGNVTSTLATIPHP